MKVITKRSELTALLKEGKIGRGTFSTGCYGLQQGKKVIVVVPTDTTEELIKELDKPTPKVNETLKTFLD